MKTQGWLSIAIATIQLAYSAAASAPRAETLNGTYVGAHYTRYNVDAFLGIPYAQSPIESLRFQVPQSLNTSWTGEKNATDFGFQCIGYGGDTELTPVAQSEDCLFLNVVRPAGFEDEKLPVAFWFTVAAMRMAAILTLATISVSSYITRSRWENRLLQSGSIIDLEEIKDAKVANLGLRDQRAALAYVKDNIAGFGGDPSKVTIWGERAGSVGSQLIAYNGRDDGLFRAAIAQSGSAISFYRYGNITKYQAQYDNITTAAGCSNATSTLICLRKTPYTTLNTLFNSSSFYQNLQYPVIDNDFIYQSPTTKLQAGLFVHVPLLIGTNFDEGASFAPQTINTDVDFRAYLSSATTDNTSIAILEALYPDIPTIGIPATLSSRPVSAPAGPGLQFKRAAALGGDSSFQAPRRLMSQIWAKENLTSYSYRFNIVPNGIKNSCGGCHFKEVAFVLDNVDGVGYVELGSFNPFEGQPESYREVARGMSGMWASFVANGNPNVGGAFDAEWPIYDGEDPQNYVFDANVTGLSYVEQDVYRAEGMKFLADHFVDVLGR